MDGFVIPVIVFAVLFVFLVCAAARALKPQLAQINQGYVDAQEMRPTASQRICDSGDEQQWLAYADRKE